ncbi:MAG: DUF4867 family protein [Eubacteriales bacterium]|nr:DUF4867 family protein [Eubacteriales bacterium]
MKFFSVFDEEFKEYGRVVEGVDTAEILDALANKTPMPETGVAYVPEEPEIQNLASAEVAAKSLFGGVPAEFGWCNGHNTKLNCLEYHRCSEFNLGVEDFVLLLAKQSEIKDFKLDTACVKAFRVPKGVLVEVYATALHYAPCHVDPEKGFKTLVVLSKGTNTDKPELATNSPEDRLLTAANKWLLAHAESAEAGNGAWVGLEGENIDIAGDL